VHRWVSLLTFSALALCVAGCGDSKVKDVKRVKVTGKVTVDNKLMSTGTITFDPENGEPPAVLDILDGRYEGMAAVGKNKIRIGAYKEISMKEKMKMDGPGYDTMVKVNALPDRYGNDSKITREVLADGQNEFNFDAQSK
jgi:hypothetical protein